MSTNSKEGILKKQSQFGQRRQPGERRQPINTIPEDEVVEKSAPDKLEEEWRESFKARQRRRSSGTGRIKLEIPQLKLPTVHSSPRKPRQRQDSFDYCKSWVGDGRHTGSKGQLYIHSWSEMFTRPYWYSFLFMGQQMMDRLSGPAG